MASQGYCTFTGIPAVLSANVTITLGINPSVISITCPPPAANDVYKVGDVTWSYVAVDEHSNDNFTRTFSDCLVDSVEVVNQGTEVWNLSLLDRRWKWAFGQISGRYNSRVNGTVLPKNRKTLRELVELCLEAMGETGYDTSVVDANEYPNVEWDLEVPAKALASLIDEYGLTVSLQKDDTVKVVRLGFGVSVPTKNRLHYSQTFDPSNYPSRIRSVSRPTVFQADLPLKAVGFEQEFDEGELHAKGNALLDAGDVDQFNAMVEQFIYGPSSTKCTELKPIEELSYAPLAPSGYRSSDPEKSWRKYPVYEYAEGEEVRTWTRLNPESQQQGGGGGVMDFSFWGIDKDNPFAYALRQRKLQLYQQNIYKLYQVDISTLKPDSNIRLPIDFDVTDIEQILPLLTHNVGREGCREDLRYKPAIVYGSFARGRNISGLLDTQSLRRHKQNGTLLRALQDNNTHAEHNLVPYEEIEPWMFQPFQDEAYNMMGGFSIEPEFGLVRFSKPMFAIEKVGDFEEIDKDSNVVGRSLYHKDITTEINPWERLEYARNWETGEHIKDADGNSIIENFARYVPAKIFLRVAVQVREKETGSYHRMYEETVIDDSLDTEPEYLPREDVHMQFVRPFDTYHTVIRDETGAVIEDSVYTDEELAKIWKDNKAQVSKELKNYNNQAIYNYLSYPGADASFAGFVDVDTDGAIKTVGYNLSNGVAKSQITRNSERAEFALTLTEARTRQKTRELISKDKKEKRSVSDAARNVRENFMDNA